MQDPKNRQKFAICAPSRAISLQLRHVSTIGKKFLKRQYRPNTSSQYGELRPTNGWDRFGNLGHPSKFQRVSHLGSVTARHSSSGRQPNFAALNRRRHLYSAWRPWCWALAHILVLELISCKCTSYTNFNVVNLHVVRPIYSISTSLLTVRLLGYSVLIVLTLPKTDKVSLKLMTSRLSFFLR